MPINWKEPAVKDRLLAAIIASFGNKINCKEVARLYGGEATYNAIENFLRGPKKAADALKEEAGDAPASSPARPRTPKKNGVAGNGVISGRVTKSTGKSSLPMSRLRIKKEEAKLGGCGDGGDTSGANADESASDGLEF